MMIEAHKVQTLLGIIRDHIHPYTIVTTNSFLSCDELNVSKFQKTTLNHSEKFVEEKSLINGMLKAHFNLF